MGTVENLIMDYGYFALYGILALGIIGLPVPDEILMTFVGYLTSTHVMSFTIALIVSILGSITGMMVSYTIGRKVGKPFLLKYGKYVKLTEKRIDKVENWFNRYGPWTINIGYFIPGFRHVTSYIAGTSGMNQRKYIIFASIGAVIWCVTFLIIGHKVGVHF
ncbi:putative membrane protein YbfM [Lysinibacillus alkalisoli]|uniref:Membrane protein YbfM n=1 Tax=Lysinibacillus alkalisoli TaxID=1911548 RepID=A0A917G7Z9_9BACI|nr:DedA family protein [Lysinibacillus alkalisoli]GGG27735.1 putative membrane protein YbfM [Lysinibacillus alkalisoli]